MIKISKAIEKLNQNLKKTFKIRSPSKESVIDMDCFNKNIKKDMDYKTWRSAKDKIIETNMVIDAVKKVGSGGEQDQALINELKARGNNLTIEQMLICFKDMEFNSRSEDHADMYWLIFHTLKELEEESFPPTNLLRLYNKYIMKVLT